MGKGEVRVDHDTAPRFTLPMTLCLLIWTRQNIIPRVIAMAAKITLIGTTAITVVVELLSLWKCTD